MQKNALDCFFAMKAALSDQHQKYTSKYEVAPTFKAGLHYGNVTTGEIGLLKKDIVFTGDTLNTAARIQSLCNQYHVDLLVSESFADAVETAEEYDFKPLGQVQLRGRNKGVELFSVSKN